MLAVAKALACDLAARAEALAVAVDFLPAESEDMELVEAAPRQLCHGGTAPRP